jgi:hypothetical protein
MLRVSGVVIASSVLALVFVGQALADVTLCAEAGGGGAPATPGLSAAQEAALLNNKGGGCVARVAGALTNIYVASDAEVFFDPFGYGKDTSDGIVVPANYVFMGGKGWVKIPSLKAFPNSQTWVLPANLTGIGCGSENEPTCEPTITFQKPNSFLGDVTGTYIMNETAGSPESDSIVLDNVGGKGLITFRSDVPEPSYVLLLEAALVGVFGLGRRRFFLSNQARLK